jgi:NADPH:quinone reductase-like Zn-dependent oxidoreductase
MYDSPKAAHIKIVYDGKELTGIESLPARWAAANDLRDRLGIRCMMNRTKAQETALADYLKTQSTGKIVVSLY